MATTGRQPAAGTGSRSGCRGQDGPGPCQRRRQRVHPMTAPPRQRKGTPPRRPRPATEPRAAEILLAGAHGGAGTSTLAMLLAPAWDMGAIRTPARGRLRACGRPVVLAARSTVAAAGQATAAVTSLAASGVPVAV